jgi:WXG100 family type VII secretion target
MTSSEILVVDFAALAQASTDIQQALIVLQRELAQLEQDAGPLVNTWDGAARAAYDAHQASWRSAAANLTQMLAGIQRAIDESAADYLATERQNVRMFA